MKKEEGMTRKPSTPDQIVKPLGDGAYKITRCSATAYDLRLWRDTPATLSFSSGRIVSDVARKSERMSGKLEVASAWLHLYILIMLIDPSTHKSYQGWKVGQNTLEN